MAHLLDSLFGGATRLASILLVSGFFSALDRSEEAWLQSSDGFRWELLTGLQSLSDVELRECFFEARPELVARLTISSKLNSCELPAGGKRASLDVGLSVEKKTPRKAGAPVLPFPPPPFRHTKRYICVEGTRRAPIGPSKPYV